MPVASKDLYKDYHGSPWLSLVGDCRLTRHFSDVNTLIINLHRRSLQAVLTKHYRITFVKFIFNSCP